MAKARTTEGREVPLVWVGLEDMPVRTANNYISQVIEDLFVVTFGFTNAPLILPGTPDEVAEQVAAVSVVTVTPVVRVAMTEGQLEKVIAGFQDNLKRFRAKKEKGKK